MRLRSLIASHVYEHSHISHTPPHAPRNIYTTHHETQEGMLALRRVGAALLGFRRLPVSSCRPAIMTTQRGVKSSRSSKGTDTSSNTSSTSSTTGTTATRKRKGRDATAPINAAFFKVDGANPPAHGADAAEGEGWVVGEVTDHAIDLHDVRPVRKRCWSNGMTGEGRNALFFFPT